MTIPQAGAVVFRKVGSRLEILIVEAKKDPGQWIFPKGHIEAGESPDAAALREAREEAGVIGYIVRPLLPVLTFQSGRELVSTQYYLIALTDEVPASETRRKRWLAPDLALQTLTHDGARKLLEDALPDIEQQIRK